MVIEFWRFGRDLEPQEIKEEIYKKLKNILKKYQT